MSFIRKLQYQFYDFLRQTYQLDYDANEDYFCANCNKPLLRRYVCCSEECDEVLVGSLN